MTHDLLNFTPFLVCPVVSILYIFIGAIFYHDLKKGEENKFPIIKSFFVGSLFILLIGIGVNLVLANNILNGEQGAFIFLYSIVALVLIFISGNILFLILVMLHQPGVR